MTPCPLYRTDVLYRRFSPKYSALAQGPQFFRPQQAHLPVAQLHPAPAGEVVEGAAHRHPAGGDGGGHLVLGAVDGGEPVGPGEQKPGQPPGHRPEGHVVQLLGQQAHRPGQVLEHGHGQLRVPGHRLGDHPPVHGHQLAGGEGHRRGHPGQLVEEGGLPKEAPRLVHVEHPLRPAVGLDEALHPAFL